MLLLQIIIKEDALIKHLLSEASNRAAIGYEQYTNAPMRTDRATNANNRSPVRGPLRGSHRATEE